MIVPREIELNTGAKMPIVGLGTWNLAGHAEEPVVWALEAGYRHIDTAKIYGTEEEIGRAIRKSNVPREEIFITTKVWNDDQGYDRTLKAIDASLGQLDMDCVDLYLVHWPAGSPSVREETWRAMEEIVKTGKAKAIGVSNYMREHLEEMESYAEMPPAVNQIEMHPRYIPNETVAYCHENEIAIVDYAPLARTRYFAHPKLVAIALRLGKTVPQVMLRWGIQQGHAVIPKSREKKHIEENIDIFSFSLADDEMRVISELDADESVV